MAKKKDVARGSDDVEPKKVKIGKTSAPPKTVIKKVVDEGAKSTAEYLGGVNKRIIIKSWEKTGKNSTRWWLEPDDKLYSAIDSSVSTIESAQSTRRLNSIKFSRLYGNYEALSFPYTTNRNAGSGQDSSNRVALNIIQSVIDAVSAKIAKDQPKVSFVTTGSDDYFLKLRANNLTKYMSGLFKQAEVYQNAELVFRDACVLGTGYIKVLEDQGQIKTEWCAMDEIRVDELDGLKQKPRCMHQIKLISRDMLCYQFPEKADKIKSAQSAVMGKIALESTVDMMRVIESWHLPSTKESNDGLHAITIDNCTLFSEDYTKDYFPIIPFRWMNKPLGYFGRSITEEILSIQIEINKILRTIQQSQELAAVPIIFVESGSQVAEDVLLSNTIARMVPYSGQPPQYVTPVAQNPEVYQHLNSFIQWAYQIVGLAQTSAAGMKPAGVDSAVAIREVSDIETGRFAQVALRWEQFFVDIARVAVDMSKDLFVRNPDLKVSISEKKILKEINWKDVDITDNPFDIQTFPTSQLPDTPAGRIQTITEYIQNQWISKEKGMELLNLDPDLEGEVNQQTSSLRLTEKWLSEMVEEGIMHKPEPYMNLQLAQSVAIGVYNQLLIDNCPEDRLDLVRQFIMDVSDLLNPPAPPEAPMGPPPPEGMPQQFAPGTGAGNAPMAASAVPMMQTV